MKIKLYLFAMVLQMQENPAPHTDFDGVGVREGIWCAGFFWYPRGWFWVMHRMGHPNKLVRSRIQT
jgi:hypothetical protein